MATTTSSTLSNQPTGVQGAESGWSKYDARDFRAMKAGRCFSCNNPVDYASANENGSNYCSVCDERLPVLHIDYDRKVLGYAWLCTDSEYEPGDRVGCGATQEDAIADFFEQVEWDVRKNDCQGERTTTT